MDYSYDLMTFDHSAALRSLISFGRSLIAGARYIALRIVGEGLLGGQSGSRHCYSRSQQAAILGTVIFIRCVFARRIRLVNMREWL